MENTKKMYSIRTKDIALIALFTALLAVCSWISVPTAIPFTMQTFGVFLTIGLLGGKRGTAAILTYLLLGAVGLPVFSGFTGGIGHILGPTGGYILGFILTALLMWLAEALMGKSLKVLAASMVAGLIICYAFGTVPIHYPRCDQNHPRCGPHPKTETICRCKLNSINEAPQGAFFTAVPETRAGGVLQTALYLPHWRG